MSKPPMRGTDTPSSAQIARPADRREKVSVERCHHAPYYGEWVLRRGEAIFGSAPGWLSQEEADARLRAAYAIVTKVSR